MASSSFQSDVDNLSLLAGHTSTSSLSLLASRGGDTELPTAQDMHPESSVFIADLILILAITIYIFLTIYMMWKYVSVLAMKEWVLCARRGYQRSNRHSARPAIDTEAEGNYNTLEEHDLSDDEDGEGIQLLQQTSSDLVAPDVAVNSSQHRGRETEVSPSRSASHTRDHSDDITSLGISKYFHPETERLRDDILGPTETALDRMCAAPEDGIHGNRPWYKPIERFSDRLILKAQAWLDGEQESIEDTRREQESRMLCDGERNRAVRQILLARQDENDGNGENDLY
ncbi:uncharacterized protein GIQ15_06648 [Arthroderma uncinatum]|uniref:uncharacterized protein n=1 Tax=Arthroderma uncinatum TaxID=74035 RepID=UPI00144A7E2E|nr:uncharacterized protein GIQ15_06648 [Arthroderma uncinatum]KAF3479672.1 hypothetical protein GIQ15_06648 [Arthroderma uncinatum]